MNLCMGSKGGGGSGTRGFFRYLPAALFCTWQLCVRWFLPATVVVVVLGVSLWVAGEKVEELGLQRK